MKNLLIIALLSLSLVSCSKTTKYGTCFGLADETNIKDAKLKYDYSKWNIFLAVVFSEVLVVPVNVVGYNLQCPTGVK